MELTDSADHSLRTDSSDSTYTHARRTSTKKRGSTSQSATRQLQKPVLEDEALEYNKWMLNRLEETKQERRVFEKKNEQLAGIVTKQEEQLARMEAKFKSLTEELEDLKMKHTRKEPPLQPRGENELASILMGWLRERRQFTQIDPAEVRRELAKVTQECAFNITLEERCKEVERKLAVRTQICKESQERVSQLVEGLNNIAIQMGIHFIGSKDGSELCTSISNHISILLKKHVEAPKAAAVRPVAAAASRPSAVPKPNEEDLKAAPPPSASPLQPRAATVPAPVIQSTPESSKAPLHTHKQRICEALDALKDELSCAVCMDLMIHESIVLPTCGHTFCRRCLMALQHSVCPVCRVSLPAQPKSTLKSCSVINHSCDKLVDLEREICCSFGEVVPDKKTLRRREKTVDAAPSTF